MPSAICPGLFAFNLVAAGLLAAPAQALELSGFRGLAWGDSPEALGADAVLASREGEVRCYRRGSENLLFGERALNGVRYCFQQGRFFLVKLDAAVAAQSLAGEFQQTYGQPDSQRNGKLAWGDKTSAARAELIATGTASSRLTIQAATPGAGPRRVSVNRP